MKRPVKEARTSGRNTWAQALSTAIGLSIGLTACSSSGDGGDAAQGASAAGPPEATQDPSTEPPQGPPSELAKGQWRASLASPGGPLTFGLDLEEAEDGRLRAVLVNGEERRPAGIVHSIPGGIVFEVPPYRSRMVAEITHDGRGLSGRWERDRGEGHKPVLPFAAVEGGQRDMGAALDPSEVAAINGTWAVDFGDDGQTAVGVFQVDATGEASGTFLTTLGDYRYLAGRFDGKQLLLSCFDGAHAFLFSAALEDGSLKGDFWSRDSYHDTWTATKDSSASLPDDFALTSWTGASELGALRFPDLDGSMRALDDPEFAGKARLLVVFGTWCPNCNDLTETLVELDAKYEDLSILGLAFELGEDPAAHTRAVREYLAHHGADYPVLIGGTMDKAKASAALPVLDRVRAYPTTIFMSADGSVSAVHTGFSGPATGTRHTALRERFESEIESLLAPAGKAPATSGSSSETEGR